MNLFDQLQTMAGAMSGPNIKAKATVKTCTQCKKQLALKEFYTDRKGKTAAMCKNCACKYQLKKRMERAEKAGVEYIPRKFDRKRLKDE